MDAGNTQAFDACLREALAQTREWVPRWLGKLHSSLKDRELSASQLSEKQGMLQARTTLESHRDLIATRFLAALAESMENALPHTGSGSRRSPTVSFDELELMGDDQVQETVELARVQQVVKMAVDEELVTLTSRLNGAQGLTVVNPDANPLRAEVIVAALMTALKGLHVPAAVRTRWLQVGAIALVHRMPAGTEKPRQPTPLRRVQARAQLERRIRREQQLGQLRPDRGVGQRLHVGVAQLRAVGRARARTRLRAVDHGHIKPVAAQLPGRGQADDAGAEHAHVRRLWKGCVHGLHCRQPMPARKMPNAPTPMP